MVWWNPSWLRKSCRSIKLYSFATAYTCVKLHCFASVCLEKQLDQRNILVSPSGSDICSGGHLTCPLFSFQICFVGMGWALIETRKHDRYFIVTMSLNYQD
uniref:Putative secreted protein n=1 Tax=Ixodes ricinus TaxID=34613 RepID=A0A6B0UF13_IXORI